MEARRVLRLDEVEIELGPAVQIEGGLEIGVGFAGGPGGLEVIDQPHQGGHRVQAQVPMPILDLLDPVFEVLFGDVGIVPLVAAEAGVLED
jgi:hypothetical protein